MGSGCSHEDLTIIREEPKIFSDKLGIWKFKVADTKCNICREYLRMMKKICVAHGIEQPWEVIDKKSCCHESLIVRNKKKTVSGSENINILTGVVECVICKISAPAFATFKTIKSNDENVDILTSEWEINKNLTKT